MKLSKPTFGIISESIRGWKRFDCQPQTAEVQDWGVPGCSRWVVVLLNGCVDGIKDVFIEECDTRSAALNLAATIHARL